MPDVIANAGMSEEERLVIALHVFAQADGGTPGQFLETLAYITRDKTWKKRGVTLRQMLETAPPHGAGIRAEDALRLIAFTHPHEVNNRAKHEELDAMRRVVRSELHEALKDPDDNQPGPGRGHKTSLQCNDVSHQSEKQGNSEAYTLRRLRRDRPDLADQVIGGELKANAAAIEAGFRKKTVSIPVDDVRALSLWLIGHWTAEQREELIVLLGGKD